AGHRPRPRRRGQLRRSHERRSGDPLPRGTPALVRERDAGARRLQRGARARGKARARARLPRDARLRREGLAPPRAVGERGGGQQEIEMAEPGEHSYPSDEGTPEEEFLYLLGEGSDLLQAGRLDAAKRELERALKMRPGNEQAKNLLGLTLFRLGELDAA